MRRDIPSPVCTGTETGPRERLYFATGFGLIQCVKALMSYEDDVRGPFLAKTRFTTVGDQRQDLLSAMGYIKHGNTIANEHRKRAASLPFRLANYVTGSTGVNWIKSMTPVELHAELVYAESLFEKACILTLTPTLPQLTVYLPA